MVESGRVPGKGSIRATIGKLSGRVSEEGRISEYQKLVESGRVPGKDRIRATIEKQFGWVSEKGRINVSTEKSKNPGEYWEKVESVPLLKNFRDEFWKG